MYIEINNLTKVIKKAKVLDNINIKLESGRIYGLKGQNGCGKTMLMRAICGLITPTAGIVTIDNEILGKDISFPRSIGALIENPVFIPNYSGFENLHMLASIQEIIDDNKIKETLTYVGLDCNDRKKYRKYSLGMKQRLGIAAAIMENPDIIMFDEPLNALDDDGIKIVYDILKVHRERGALIIITCHDLIDLVKMSDEIFTIQCGRIVDHKNADEFLIEKVVNL